MYSGEPSIKHVFARLILCVHPVIRIVGYQFHSIPLSRRSVTSHQCFFLTSAVPFQSIFKQRAFSVIRRTLASQFLTIAQISEHIFKMSGFSLLTLTPIHLEKVINKVSLFLVYCILGKRFSSAKKAIIVFNRHVEMQPSSFERVPTYLSMQMNTTLRSTMNRHRGAVVSGARLGESR